MPIVKVPETDHPRPYWPQELKKEGYTGNLKVFTGVCTLVIPTPNASARDIAKDLKLLAQQFEYKAEIAERAEREAQSPHSF